MKKTIIDILYEENQALDKYLEENGEISLRSNIDSNFRKTLLLAVASYFEFIVTDNILKLVEEQINTAIPLLHFIKNKAIERQYHTYFDWNSRNANTFFGLFGSDFKEFMKTESRSNLKFESSIRAFIELGQIRNQLVHENFAVFPLDKTVEEIYQLYKDALVFIESFPIKVREFLKT
ncbi:MAG: HEPN domain-containing protein [bacterium]